ncbi:MAG TPA: zf-HC2 domain-containing protein [Gemmatimonadaceae bacterium]|nr:zf-HC2 domain-containing protein [Gemmatimonadaceae bacterium]
MGYLFPDPHPISMDCREFSEKHLAFVDDTLAGVELVRMQRHTAECEPCAKHDAKVRRALLLFRNLPPIEPSTGFTDRLEARIKEAHENDLLLETTRRNLTRGAVAATVATLASAVMLAYIGSTVYQTEMTRDVVMPPVVAIATEPDLTPITTSTPAIVASASAGLAIWPVALFAEEAPVRFAHSRFELAKLNR